MTTTELENQIEQMLPSPTRMGVETWTFAKALGVTQKEVAAALASLEQQGRIKRETKTGFDTITQLWKTTILWNRVA